MTTWTGVSGNSSSWVRSSNSGQCYALEDYFLEDYAVDCLVWAILVGNAANWSPESAASSVWIPVTQVSTVWT